MEILKVIVDKVPDSCADCKYCVKPSSWDMNLHSRARCLLSWDSMTYANMVGGRLPSCSLVKKGVDDNE